MATLIIRKKSGGIFEHYDSQLFILSNFYVKVDVPYFQIQEIGGSQRKQYLVSEITVFDDTLAGSAETFTSFTGLMQRLKFLGYPAFNQNSGGGGGGGMPDAFTQLGSLTKLVNTVTVGLNYEWFISNNSYANVLEFDFNIVLELEDFNRKDIIVANSNNGFELISGFSSFGSNTAIQPFTPIGKILLSVVNIFGNSVENNEVLLNSFKQNKFYEITLAELGVATFQLITSTIIKNWINSIPTIVEINDDPFIFYYRVTNGDKFRIYILKERAKNAVVTDEMVELLVEDLTEYVPLSGTAEGSPITGGLEFEDFTKSLFIKSMEEDTFYILNLSETSCGFGYRDENNLANNAEVVFNKNQGIYGFQDFTPNYPTDGSEDRIYPQIKYVKQLVAASNFNSNNLGPTGLNQGGLLTINTDAAKFDLSAGFGYVVNGHSNPDNPTFTKVTWTAKIANTIPNLATQKQTYVAVDINGDLYFTNVPLTATQRRNFIRIGVLIHLNNSAVTYIDNQPTINIEIGGQVQDILEALGFRSLSGNRIFPVSNNLKIKKELGRVFKPGANFDNLTTQPHSFTLDAQEPITFRYRTQTGDEGADITDITPAIYDLNGTITPVAATATLATIQRVYIFQDGVIRIQPGQRVFTTLNAAITALNSDVFITDLDIAENGLYLGAIVLTRNAVDLSNISQAIFAPSIGTTANGSVASPALAYTAEDVANKQNSLAVDGTGAKYPTVDAVNTGLSTLLPNPLLGNILRGNGTAYAATTEVEFMRVKSPFLKSHLATDINFDKLIYWDNFIRPNSVSLGTADSGQVYQNLNGAGWSIVGNEANSSEFSITAIPITSAGATTSYISKNLLRNSAPNTARRAGIAFLKDKDNNISLTINRNNLIVTKKTNGVDTILLSQAVVVESVAGVEFFNTEIDLEFRIYSNLSKTFVFIFSNFLNISRIVDIQDTSYFNNINFFGFLAFENTNPVVISSKLIKDI